ncbi:TetR/AcrR family transcriptional regulator [Shewanella algae]|uniref:TetR/AcrR family transcriptional regulator n=1 Tax=Shewanella algae TaxID=38313 RepID=UPI000D1A2B6E|nr:TetR/AcrR family transcriptional regulator [Shewanella algae]MBO2548610.1 TetR/AcrR family transcriptional regulator [Shewanella algae]MBO2587397.1 TetR/AcrR family transcriptional regulator [Shewanella algae]MBO2616892.1 TetR/AcrR family transcriptional regulator [Shewanella algae]PSS69468.1 TetR family transcriptional regulator [Shewanella algae]QTE93650.1 TetR/AcrR family transcriptional regulator [Shewanella algae]
MRNAEFDREKVLRSAMNAFMAKGYSKTSMQDLTRATGLHPGSIYCAFDNKHGLFLAAIDQYHADREQQLQGFFPAEGPRLECLRRYLDNIVSECLSCDASQACLLVKALSEVGEQDLAVQQRVSQHLQQWQTALQQILQQAQVQGELAADKDPAQLTRFLMMGIYGLRTYAHTHPSADELSALATELFEHLSL